MGKPGRSVLKLPGCWLEDVFGTKVLKDGSGDSCVVSVSLERTLRGGSKQVREAHLRVATTPGLRIRVL